MKNIRSNMKYIDNFNSYCDLCNDHNNVGIIADSYCDLCNDHNNVGIIADSELCNDHNNVGIIADSENTRRIFICVKCVITATQICLGIIDK